MTKITNDQIDFMREDMENDYGYTKIMMISDFIKECKKENPDISREELMERIKEFRKEKGWDPEDDDGEDNNDQVDFDQVDFIVGIWNQFTDTRKITMISDFADECKKEDPDISREELMERIREFRKEKGWDTEDDDDEN